MILSINIKTNNVQNMNGHNYNKNDHELQGQQSVFIISNYL